MKRSLNLMPESSTRRRIVSEATWLWLRVLIASGVVAAFGGALQAWRSEDARQRTAALSAQHKPVKQLRDELDVLQARINAVYHDEYLTLAIADAPKALSVLAGVAEAAKELGHEGYVHGLRFEIGELTAGTAASRELGINGLAREPEAIRRFIAALKETGYFTEVTLGATQAQLLRGTATTAFEITCLL